MEQLAQKIVNSLTQLNGCAIGSITAVTNVVLKGGKKNPMQGEITKVAKNANVMFFCNSKSNGYQNMVKRRLEAEGKAPESFKLSKRVWGERIADTPFVTHKGQLYVEVIFLRAPSKVEYMRAGLPIAKEDIEGLPVDKQEGKQGGLEDKVIIRTYKLSSLREIKMGELSVA